MAFGDVTREGVESACKEFDRVGRDAMLAKYGGRPSSKLYIEHKGKYYDQRLILRAAHALQFSKLLPIKRGAKENFTTYQIRRHLTDLGFNVVRRFQAENLPPLLVDKITKRLGLHTVLFIRVNTQEIYPEPMGCGVLVSAGNTRAILTAYHVVQAIDALPANERLGVLLEGTNQLQTIDRNGIQSLKIARGKNDLNGPDLGAFILAPIIAGSIASIKVFYILDGRRDQLIDTPPDLNGVWVALGYVGERTVVSPLPGGKGGTVTFNGNSLFSCPEVVRELDGYDYWDYPLGPLSEQPPHSWKGLSGSGLWQIPLNSQGGSLGHDPPLLSGILFYEHKVKSHWWIRCHGRQSIYEQAFKAIQDCDPQFYR